MAIGLIAADVQKLAAATSAKLYGAVLTRSFPKPKAVGEPEDHQARCAARGRQGYAKISHKGMRHGDAKAGLGEIGRNT